MALRRSNTRESDQKRFVAGMGRPFQQGGFQPQKYPRAKRREQSFPRFENVRLNKIELDATCVFALRPNGSRDSR